MRVTSDIRFLIPAPEPRATAAHDEHTFIEVLVEVDGTVWAWDGVARAYSTLHDLTTDEMALARELAGKVRAGTHYILAGTVREIRVKS